MRPEKNTKTLPMNSMRARLPAWISSESRNRRTKKAQGLKVKVDPEVKTRMKSV